MRSANQMQPFGIDRAHAGPFVNVLTISGPVENGAQERLVVELADPGLASKHVVVDLTEATLYDSWPFPLLLDETDRFRSDGGELVVVSGANSTVEPFVQDGSLDGLRWCKSLDDALIELLAEVVERAGWSTEVPVPGAR
jgi:anti-anti-sigma regulatory factor